MHNKQPGYQLCYVIHGLHWTGIVHQAKQQSRCSCQVSLIHSSQTSHPPASMQGTNGNHERCWCKSLTKADSTQKTATDANQPTKHSDAHKQHCSILASHSYSTTCAVVMHGSTRHATGSLPCAHTVNIGVTAVCATTSTQKQPGLVHSALCTYTVQVDTNAQRHIQRTAKPGMVQSGHMVQSRHVLYTSYCCSSY